MKLAGFLCSYHSSCIQIVQTQIFKMHSELHVGDAEALAGSDLCQKIICVPPCSFKELTKPLRQILVAMVYERSFEILSVVVSGVPDHSW